MNGPALRRAIIDTCQQLHSRGWVANHDGNVTARIGPDRFLATPTAMSKAAIQSEMLITVDSAGKKVAGQKQVFSEINLHVLVYALRPDVKAVVHAHPPAATARACAGLAMNEAFLPEAVVSIGPEIPLVPLSPPGMAALQALEPFVERYDAVLLQNHGVLTWGNDPEMALLRMELVEHMARICRDAAPYGGVRPLPRDMLGQLMDARARAGLGPEGRAQKKPRFLAAREQASRPKSAMDVMRRLVHG